MGYPSLSVVIAGPIRSRVSESDAIRNIQSYKGIFPQMEIILSTYEGEVYDSLFTEVDLIVYSEDPGLDSYRKWSTISRNTTRMLITGFEGLKAAKMQISIKSRIEINVNEIQLLRDSIVNVFGAQTKNSTHLITTGPFFENPKEYFLQPYYISDTFQIGKTPNLLAGWGNALHWYQTMKLQDKFQHLHNPVVPANEQILGFGFMRLLHPTKRMREPNNRYLFLLKERDLIESFVRFYWLAIPDERLGLESGRLNSYDFSNTSVVNKYENYLKMRVTKTNDWNRVPILEILQNHRNTTKKFLRISLSWHVKNVLKKIGFLG